MLPLYKKGWEIKMYIHICLFLGKKKCQKANPKVYENGYLPGMEEEDAKKTEPGLFWLSLLIWASILNKATVLYI